MITKYEYLTLKERYKKGYHWIARDKDGCLYIYYREPKRLVFSWKDAELSFFEWSVIDDLFPCVKWEDAKPTKILDLIQDYEKHEELKCKVVIPQFVADWIEKHKKVEDGFNVLEAYDYLKESVMVNTSDKEKTEKLSKVLGWVRINGDLFIDAWRYGYEIEKEKLYTVRLANGDCLCRIASKGLSWVLTHQDYRNDKNYQLTQSEIESVDPVLMNIAKVVE